MKNTVQLLCLLILVFATSVIAQKTPSGTATENVPSWKDRIKTVEILSPWDDLPNGKVRSNPEKYKRNCFDLIRFEFGCYGRDGVGVHFGDRIGKNTSIFTINGGSESRTRMIEIGEYAWTDKFMVPYLEPWPALGPGERRTINVNASGGSGAPGSPGNPGRRGVAGMNGDGTYTRIPQEKPEPAVKQTAKGSKDYANASLNEQVGSTVTTADGKTRNDPYTPMTEAKLGRMYVVRVTNETNDYYVLLRVDELVPGTRVVVSYWKLDLPITLW